MADSVQQYIASGVLEAYLFGSLSGEEEQEVLVMRKKFPAINLALAQLEDDMEQLAMHMAVPPPPALWDRISSEMNELVETKNPEINPFIKSDKKAANQKENNDQQFIEVEAQSSYIKVHRLWRWVFAAVFVLSKIFLIAAIYYYVENRHNQEEIQQLKTQVQQMQKLK